MNNMFGHFDVDYRYDLKGSTLGRKTDWKGEEKDLKVAMKDLDFIDNEEIVDLESEDD
jgi:hypothetical protein